VFPVRFPWRFFHCGTGDFWWEFGEVSGGLRGAWPGSSNLLVARVGSGVGSRARDGRAGDELAGVFKCCLRFRWWYVGRQA